MQFEALTCHSVILYAHNNVTSDLLQQYMLISNHYDIVIFHVITGYHYKKHIHYDIVFCTWLIGAVQCNSETLGPKN